MSRPLGNRFYVTGGGNFSPTAILHIHSSNMPKEARTPGRRTLCKNTTVIHDPTDEQLVLGRICQICQGIFDRIEAGEQVASEVG